jgi:sugar phosphate isomerase/epimerase
MNIKPKIGALVSKYSELKSDLELIRSCGYDYGEFGFSAPENFMQEYAKNYQEYSKIIPVFVAHTRTAFLDKEEIERLKSFISEHLAINCRNFVLHFYTAESPVTDIEKISQKISGLLELADFTKKNGANLFIENTYFCLVEDMAKVFGKVDGVYFCLDVGHANLSGGTQLALDLMDNFKDKLKHFHLHDNLGGEPKNENDRHLPVGTAKIDFPAIFQKLKEINFSGTITSEVHDSSKEARQTSIDNIKKFLA